MDGANLTKVNQTLILEQKFFLEFKHYAYSDQPIKYMIFPPLPLSAFADFQV